MKKIALILTAIVAAALVFNFNPRAKANDSSPIIGKWKRETELGTVCIRFSDTGHYFRFAAVKHFEPEQYEAVKKTDEWYTFGFLPKGWQFNAKDQLTNGVQKGRTFDTYTYTGKTLSFGGFGEMQITIQGNTMTLSYYDFIDDPMVYTRIDEYPWTKDEAKEFKEAKENSEKKTPAK